MHDFSASCGLGANIRVPAFPNLFPPVSIFAPPLLLGAKPKSSRLLLPLDARVFLVKIKIKCKDRGGEEVVGAGLSM